MKKLVVTLPESIKNLPEHQRRAVVEELKKALDLTQEKEHSIWTMNDDPLLGAVEEDLYEALVTPAMESMATLIAALGLTEEQVDIYKSLPTDYLEYEELTKGSSKKNKASSLWDLAKTKRKDFMKYIEGGSNWTKKKLKQIEDILKQGLPDYAKIAEDYAVRAAFIGKIRNKADTEALETLGAYVDRFPKTIEAAKKEGVVLTATPKINPNLVAVDHENTSITVGAEELEAARNKRTKHKAEKVKILPLQPQEVRTVENAEIRTGEKLTEVADRHRAAIKQIVLQAINGRWSAQQLAQALFKAFGEQNRDWRRVAITELAMASSDAYLAGCEEGDTVIVPAVEGSCRYCKKYLEGKSFIVTHDPAKMGHDYQQEMNYVWVGKTNYGRTTASYIPCIPLHPNCRHRWHKLSRFYKMDENGKPVLKTTKELIQEERARRGLPPDPNLI